LKRATPKTNPTSPSEVISTLTLNEIERIYKMKQVMRDIVKKLSTTFSFSKKGGENE